jgi:hypothetical protein
VANKTITGAVVQQNYRPAASWSAENPVLSSGELGIESDSKKVKIGDGSAVWNNLPYFSSGGASASSPGELGFAVGQCATAGNTAAKTVAAAGFVLKTPSYVSVKFNAANTANSPTLNVGGTGAYPITYNGNALGSNQNAYNYDFISNKGYHLFVFETDRWNLINPAPAGYNGANPYRPMDQASAKAYIEDYVASAGGSGGGSGIPDWADDPNIFYVNDANSVSYMIATIDNELGNPYQTIYFDLKGQVSVGGCGSYYSVSAYGSGVFPHDVIFDGHSQTAKMDDGQQITLDLSYTNVSYLFKGVYMPNTAIIVTLGQILSIDDCLLRCLIIKDYMGGPLSLGGIIVNASFINSIVIDINTSWENDLSALEYLSENNCVLELVLDVPSNYI